MTGIRVLSDEDRRGTPGRPWLYVSVAACKLNNSALYVYHIGVALRQDTWLVRNGAIEGLGAVTWDTADTFGSIGAAKIRELREDVLDRVDQFINAYLAVNPEQAGAGRHSRSKGTLVPDASIIRAVQWQLQEAEFDPGPVDGKLGTQTRLALRQYQTRRGLPTTGELDEVTRQALGLK